MQNTMRAEKTIDQVRVEWHEALDEPSNVMRDFNIQCIENGLRDDALSLKHFRLLVAFSDYQRDVIKALDAI